MTSTKGARRVVPPAATTEAAESARSVAAPVKSFHLAMWLAGIFFICFVFFVPFPMGPNESAHVVMTLAMVDHGTVAIDAYHQNTQDLAFHGGHYYINKPPGQSLLGVPVYLAFKAVSAFNAVNVPPLGSISPAYKAYILLVYVESICTVAIPAVLFLMLFFWFLGFFSASLVNRTILTLALGLGTTMFRYADTVYSHLPVAGLLFAGFVLIWMQDHSAAMRGPRSTWFVHHPHTTTGLAGLCLGASFLFEYSSIPIALLLGIYSLNRLPRHLWPYLALGAAPGVLVTAGYNLANFGNPLITGYANSTTAFPGVHRHRSGVGGAYQHVLQLFPKPRALAGLSLSPFRGLFFMSPFLLLAFPGYRLWSRRGEREWILFLAIPIFQFLAISMFAGWSGGFAIGPRYLIPMLPFLAFPVIFVLDRPTRWIKPIAYALLAISFAVVWIETLGGPAYPGSKVLDPLFSYSLPQLTAGYLRTNLVTLVDFLRPNPLQIPHTVRSLWATILLATALALWSVTWWTRAKAVAARVMDSPAS